MILVDTSVWIRFLADKAPYSKHLDMLLNRGEVTGRGIGWIDVHLLASAIVNHLRFWTADERLAAIAAECGVAWEIPSL